jgi:putative inorganic carbon (HCO3(-)) transporter
MPNWIEKYLPSSLQDNSEKTAFLALAGCISLDLVSIAASQILLAVAIAGFLWMLKQNKGPLAPGMPVLLPLLAFMVWTVLAVFASSNVTLGLTSTRKFYLLLLVPVVPLIVRGENRLIWIYRAIFAVAIASSLRGLAQFAENPHRDLLHRISGFMSHWMTYSGLLMLVLVLLTAYVLSVGVRRDKWVIPVAAFVVLALVLSQTRSTWMGAVGGILVLILMRRPRAIIVVLAAILVLYAASPASIKQRLQAGFDPTDPNTRNRIELFQTSVRLIRDNPWFGVGPKNVKYEALKYRGHNEFPDWMYQHMHNDFLQIAAETGIPGAIIWLWLMIRFAWDALSCYRYAKGLSFAGREKLRKEALMASSAALAAWVALMAAGMFEYNFGDSEVLTLFLFIVSAPYAFMVQLSAVPRGEIQDSKISASE